MREKVSLNSLLNLEKTDLYQVVKSKTDLKTELEKYQTLQQQQPQHRDVLLNLALIELELGNEENWRKYFEEAKTMDPNYQVFVNKTSTPISQ